MIEPVTVAMARTCKATRTPFLRLGVGPRRASERRAWLLVDDGQLTATRTWSRSSWRGEDSVCNIATKATARKTRDLAATGRCVVAGDTGSKHVVVEATARRVTGDTGMQHASATFAAVYDWPVTVIGDTFDTPYAAPASGGPPFQVWELTPTKAFGFPVDGESTAPTRWRF
jgi:hypothetical protein